MPFDKETAKLYGAAGGRANVRNNGREHMVKIGAIGGQAMLERGGKAYFSKIGSVKGYKRRTKGANETS